MPVLTVDEAKGRLEKAREHIRMATILIMTLGSSDGKRGEQIDQVRNDLVEAMVILSELIEGTV